MRRGEASGSGGGPWAAPRRNVVGATELRDCNGRVLAPMGVSELTRNAVDVRPAGALEEKLKLGRPLRVKLGIDVTSPDVHVGHAIPLQRMRAFQDAGHQGVLIVGDYTTRIGDPSGRSTERPILSEEEIDRNAKAYFEQAKQVIDPDRTEVRFNGEWLGQVDFAEGGRPARAVQGARPPGRGYGGGAVGEKGREPG